MESKLCMHTGLMTSAHYLLLVDSNRPNWLTYVYTIAAQFPTLDYSNGWIPLFWFAEEYVTTKVTRRMNGVYDLFTHVHTSTCVVTFFSIMRFRKLI